MQKKRKKYSKNQEEFNATGNHNTWKKIMASFMLICIVSVVIWGLTGNQSSPLSINTDIEKMLGYLGIENCEIIKLADYRGLNIKLRKMTASESDIENYISNMLEDYGKTELSAEFIKKEFDMNSMEEFYQYVKEEVIVAKEVQEHTSARKQIREQLITGSDFNLDQNNIAKYSLEIVESYEEEAYLYNMELEEYVNKELHMTDEEFYQMCYEEGADYVKTYLVFGAIAMKEQLGVTEQDIEEFEDSDNMIIDRYSEEEQTYRNYQILENKVYGLFITDQGGQE